MRKGARGLQKKAVAVSGKVQHASEVPASSEILEVAQVLAVLASQPDAVASALAHQASEKRRCGDLDSLTERTHGHRKVTLLIPTPTTCWNRGTWRRH